MRIVDSRQTTFTAAGVATVTFGPVPYSRRWRITSLNVGSESALNTSCSVYRNSVGRPSRLDVTPFDGNDNTSDTVYELEGAETLIVQWEGGTPGAAADATIEGMEEVR